MSKTSAEAFLIGVGLWVVGAAVIVLLGDVPFFPTVAPPAALLLVPVIYRLTKWHLRDVAAPNRLGTSLRLSILATAVQFPLDICLLLSMYQLGVPDLSLAGQRATVFALLVGYSCLLLVPWWVTARAEAV